MTSGVETMLPMQQQATEKEKRKEAGLVVGKQSPSHS
jgi:hypothetical protein